MPAGAEPNRITDYPSYLHAEPLAHTDYDHTHTARLTNARLQHTGGARGHTHPGYRRDVPRSTNTYVYPGDPA